MLNVVRNSGPARAPQPTRALVTDPEDTAGRFTAPNVSAPDSGSRARATLSPPARLAQLVEHLICNQGVGGSSPPAGFSKFAPYGSRLCARRPRDAQSCFTVAFPRSWLSTSVPRTARMRGDPCVGARGRGCGPPRSCKSCQPASEPAAVAAYARPTCSSCHGRRDPHRMAGCARPSG